MSLTNHTVNKWIRYSLYSGLGWLIFGLTTVILLNKNNAYSNSFVFIEFLMLSFGSLFFLTKVVADLIRVTTLEGERKAEAITGTMVWGFLKVATLGVTVWRMTETNEQNGLALALGVGTLFVVPMSSAFIDKIKFKRN